MALRLPRGTSANGRFTAWVGVAGRIYEEQVSQGWRHKMFRLVRAVFATNPKLSEEGGFLFNWAAENYLDAALMSLRRELDVQAGTENLRNLLEDIAENPDVLTRARYVALWPGEAAFASEMFERFNPTTVPGNPSGDHIGSDQANADLEHLRTAAGHLRVHAERTRAHRSPERGIDRSLTFRDLHAAIREVRQVAGKYHALLTLTSVARWEPTAQFSVIEPFTSPWVVDADAVARAAVEDSENGQASGSGSV